MHGGTTIKKKVNIFFQQNVETFYIKMHGKYSNQKTSGNLV
jgi:hypothetical protein